MICTCQMGLTEQKCDRSQHLSFEENRTKSPHQPVPQISNSAIVKNNLDERHLRFLIQLQGTKALGCLLRWLRLGAIPVMKEPVAPMKRWASSYSQLPDTSRSSVVQMLSLKVYCSRGAIALAPILRLGMICEGSASSKQQSHIAAVGCDIG